MRYTVSGRQGVGVAAYDGARHALALLAWRWRMAWGKKAHRALACVCAAMSAIVLWSELSLVRSVSRDVGRVTVRPISRVLVRRGTHTHTQMAIDTHTVLEGGEAGTSAHAAAGGADMTATPRLGGRRHFSACPGSAACADMPAPPTSEPRGAAVRISGPPLSHEE